MTECLLRASIRLGETACAAAAGKNLIVDSQDARKQVVFLNAQMHIAQQTRMRANAY